MSRWEIRLPYRSRSDSLADVGEAARELPPEERGCARQLALDAASDGLRSVGELLDALEHATPEERRQRLDRARAECGLADTRTVDGRRAVDEASAARRRMAQPVRLGVGLTAGGALVDLDEAAREAARDRAAAEHREAEHRQRQAERAVEAEQRRRNQEVLNRGPRGAGWEPGP